MQRTAVRAVCRDAPESSQVVFLVRPVVIDRVVMFPRTSMV